MKRRRQHLLHDDCILLTQQQIADVLGVTRGAVSMAERKALRKIKAAIVNEAQRCGVSVREYLYGEADSSK